MTTAGCSLYPVPLLCLSLCPNSVSLSGPLPHPSLIRFLSFALPCFSDSVLSLPYFLSPSLSLFPASSSMRVYHCFPVFLSLGIRLVLAMSGTDLSSSPRT